MLSSYSFYLLIYKNKLSQNKNSKYDFKTNKKKLPFSNRDLFVSVQNSIRLERFLSGAHRYRSSPVQFLVLAAFLKSEAFIGHLSTPFT